jgi:hypothetical protein
MSDLPLLFAIKEEVASLLVRQDFLKKIYILRQNNCLYSAPWFD